MPTVQTVFQPGVDLEVSEAEAEVLRRQGLVLTETLEPASPGAVYLPDIEPGTESQPRTAPAKAAPAMAQAGEPIPVPANGSPSAVGVASNPPTTPQPEPATTTEPEGSDTKKGKG